MYANRKKDALIYKFSRLVYFEFKIIIAFIGFIIELSIFIFL
jgi:hypothetical protein